MAHKITIATCIGFTNRGAEALLRTRIEAIRSYIPDAQFCVLTIYRDSCSPIEGVEYIQTFGGQREKLKSPRYLASSLLQAVIWTFEAVRFRYFGKTFLPDLRKIAESDLFVSTDGDVLGEDYGLPPYAWRLYYLTLGSILRKPVVIYAEGLGPFRSRAAKMLSKWFFSRCSYISVRDEQSKLNLRSIGITRDVDVVADSAFLLKQDFQGIPAASASDKPLFGIAVSKLATEYGFGHGAGVDAYSAFLTFTAEIIDWLIEDYKANVILMPHVVQVNRNDFKTAQDIRDQVKRKDAVEIIGSEFNASQLKAFISRCDLLIASRMHAAIAALSSGVPVIGIGYSHKMKGVLSLMDYSYVIDIKTLDRDLKPLIADIMKNKENIKKSLIAKREKVEHLALRPAKIVAGLLSANKTFSYDITTKRFVLSKNINA